MSISRPGMGWTACWGRWSRSARPSTASNAWSNCAPRPAVAKSIATASSFWYSTTRRGGRSTAAARSLGSNCIMRHAVIIDAVRTPIGRAHRDKGIFRDVRADDLSADLMKALLVRTGVPASEIEDIHWGCVKQQGEQGYDIARMAALIAGLPIEVGGVTVNRNCGSSLQAINQAAQSIAAQCEDVQIAGGVEHMDHIPMETGFDPSPRLFYRHSPATLNMGLTAENLALRYKISRREQDEFALRSHQRAAQATDSGPFTPDVIPPCAPDEE